MIAIDMSVAIFQLPTYQFKVFGKKAAVYQYKYLWMRYSVQMMEQIWSRSVISGFTTCKGSPYKKKFVIIILKSNQYEILHDFPN